MLFFTTAKTCFNNLLHTAIKACFPVLPFDLKRSYNALQAVLVFIAFMLHIYSTSRKFLPLRLYPWLALYAGSAAVLCGRKTGKADQLPVIGGVFKPLGKHYQHGCCPFTDTFYTAYIF